jgi:hypothetical protein
MTTNQVIDMCIEAVESSVFTYNAARRQAKAEAIAALGQLKKDPLTINKQG